MRATFSWKHCSPDRHHAWITRWEELVEFEVVPVLASAEFWEQQAHSA